jgi:hypothetical protein
MANDEWMTSRPGGAIGSVDEGVRVLVRCTACTKSFTRPRGSAETHQQADPAVSCPPDAEVEPLEKAARWTRR